MSVGSVARRPRPIQRNTVGPRELQNFNLGGTVLRRAEPEAAVVPPASGKFTRPLAPVNHWYVNGPLPEALTESSAGLPMDTVELLG